MPFSSTGFAMRVSPNPRRLLIAVAAAILGLALAFPGAARAGFLDDLFGPLFNPPAYRGYGAYPMPAPAPETRQRTNRGSLSRGQRGAARKKIIAAAKTDHPVRPDRPVDLMEDSSLLKGDAVVTPAGVRIFVGYSGDHHEPEDFRKPAEIKGLSKAERKALAALDAQASVSGGARGIVTGRSAAGRNLSAGELITDARGRMIRYVGP
ncbi:MAG: hypothetical protein L0Y60_05360 [Beijerinckiaceae bacterium]|nr:hypothetical protein [Beijerinckiaceae bacterium]